MRRRLTGEEREIHKQAVSIRKVIAATPDKALVEWSKTAKEYNNEFRKKAISKVTEPEPPSAPTIFEKFFNEISEIGGVGKVTIKKLREFAEKNNYL